jgi:hypothetical protein
MSHTPGPWGIQPDEHGGPSDTVYAYEDQQQEVAEIVSGVSADRHLIAAAPELLDALVAMREAFTSNGTDSQHNACRMADAALAKAEGVTMEDEYDSQN